VETVASLAVLLDQRRPDLPSFYSALTSSENEDDEAKDRLAECRRRLDTLDAGIHQANTTRTRLARVLRDLQDARELEIPRTEEKKASVPNLTKKGQEYSDKVRRMEVRSCLFVCLFGTLGPLPLSHFHFLNRGKRGKFRSRCNALCWRSCRMIMRPWFGTLRRPSGKSPHSKTFHP